MLLTSSQISMGISSAIVFTFSTILFLSGYVLQQRTVNNLRAVLSPPLDPSAVSTSIVEAVAKRPDNVQWNKVAYVQIIQQYTDVCSAAIVFAELARQESKARRVLLYPRTWDSEGYGGKQQERSLRLLRKVATRYNLSLRPIEPELDEAKQASAVAVDRLYSLLDLQSLVHLSLQGVIYNATALDELFTLDPTGAGIHFPSSSATEEPLALMAKPSMTTYKSLREEQSSTHSLNDMITTTSSSAKQADHRFGETSLLSQSGAEGLLPAYIRFSDPGIPGPQYDIPQKLWEQVRPTAEPERGIWEGVYADYRAQRMGVCGLDVEPMPLVLGEEMIIEESGEKVAL